MVFLTNAGKSNILATSTWSNYYLVPVVFEGTYDSYGRLENTKLF